jgi:hypothetical protein
VALAVALLRAPSARAGAADVSLARQLGNEGLQLAASGDCAGAVEKLKRAEGLYHAPTTLTVLGECHVTLGKLVDGVEELTRVAREELGRAAPLAFRKAQIRARQKLEAARLRLPKLRLTVDGAAADAVLEVRIRACLLRRSVWTAPWIRETTTSKCRPSATRARGRTCRSRRGRRRR